MVLLNIDISVNKKTMINSIKNLMEKVMESYFNVENYVEDKNKLVNSIIKKRVEKIQDNHFWYINPSENICTYVHKRGKKDGHMCHKKINTNIEGEKQDYLCCIHSKKHMPKRNS